MKDQGQSKKCLSILVLLLLLATGLLIYHLHPGDGRSGVLVCKEKPSTTLNQSLRSIRDQLEYNRFLVEESRDAVYKDVCDGSLITRLDGLVCPVTAVVEARPDELPAAQVQLNCLCSRVDDRLNSIVGVCEQITQPVSVIRIRKDYNVQDSLCPEGAESFWGEWVEIRVNKSCSFRTIS
ncbi:hypothetical protein BOX15_Mlig006618g1 [Macrostomum lignano]|uniref:Uncharacterized protein n=1 Tax=Macrostomum lignano TaxID=282301 RepID=A0A267E472_9PLAT|nr:hypothetical protein BOX15_Mlig006618g1 [Macrostomum lignano]